MANLYVRNWEEFPVVEVQPNNFRRSVVGENMGINYISVKHPMRIPNHVHVEEEQVMLIQKGRINIHMDGQDDTIAKVGDIVVIPKGMAHWLESDGCDCEFIEIFSPRRVQNLIGFIGRIF
ncbi:MAG: cupin domain-containing protein [Oscillospiraceae bacterium]|nr:cupin domain-containing protein [Oscillospiraceae bacterium]